MPITTTTEKNVGEPGHNAGPKCQQCEKNPAEPEHECPYQVEINDEHRLCNCCADCRYECSMDI